MIKGFVRYLPPGVVMSLVIAIAVVSVASVARGATGKARVSATVIAPATVQSVIPTISSRDIVSGMTDDCVQRTGNLVGCIPSRVDDGILTGDPVNGLGLEVAEQERPGRARVNVTVRYN